MSRGDQGPFYPDDQWTSPPVLGTRWRKSSAAQLVYAWVHNQTAADDYCAAMTVVEQRLALVDQSALDTDLSDTTGPGD